MLYSTSARSVSKFIQQGGEVRAMLAEHLHARATHRDTTSGRVGGLLVVFAARRGMGALAPPVAPCHARAEGEVDEEAIGACEAEGVAVQLW